MQSEDFDKKIKDAAEHHHPAYDEKAWSKMEQLLDEHLPVEKERNRRFLFILFFFLLLGGGAALWLGNGRLSNERRSIVFNGQMKEEQVQPGEKTQTESKDGKSELDGNMEADDNTELKANDRSGKQENDKNVRTDRSDKNDKTTRISVGISNNNSAYINRKKEVADLKKGKGVEKDQQPLTREFNPSIENKPSKDNRNNTDLLLTAQKDQDSIAKAILPDPALPSDADKVSLEKKGSQRIEIDKTEEGKHIGFPAIDSLNLAETKQSSLVKTGRKKGVFFLAASLAPDLSVVGLKEIGKVRTAYGFGLGYTRGRVTLRSGLYVVRKIYDAYPEDYKAPPAFYTRYPNLQEVKADCKVYEIPLLVSYDLKKGGHGHWFLTTGISSYLMKRETYDYYYKWNTTGPVVHRERTINNANQHYFSVATFSAGYKTNLSKKLFLLAEPYVKLPMTGIGFGKVKLNGAGVLFTIGYKPFSSKKSK